MLHLTYPAVRRTALAFLAGFAVLSSAQAQTDGEADGAAGEPTPLMIEAPDPAQITLMAVYTAKPGREADLREALLDLVAASRGRDGLRDYHLHQDPVNPAVFVFYENYADQRVLNAQAQSEAFQALSARFGELLDRPVENRRWLMISERP